MAGMRREYFEDPKVFRDPSRMVQCRLTWRDLPLCWCVSAEDRWGKNKRIPKSSTGLSAVLSLRL